jgi:branched-chain amino acid aminotransferase
LCMALKIWLNTGLVDEADAKISVFDHGLLYGDGVFEGIRVYGSRVFELDAHLRRLFESARVIRLGISMSKEDLAQAVRTTVEANAIRDGYIRLVATRGIGTLGLNPFVCKESSLIIIADKIQLYPEELYEKGMKIISATTVRNHPLALPPQVKSLNYLNNILAKIEALDNDVPEAIMYNHEGYVAEATGDNVFIVRNGVVYAPPVEAGSLEGITRAVVMRLAQQEGFKVVEKNLTRHDLYVCDELFLTGTAAEVIGIVEIDGRIIGEGKPGPVTRLLREKFDKYARQEEK